MIEHYWLNSPCSCLVCQLPGGKRGFSKVIWTVKEYVGGGDSPCITLYYHSFDGEEGNTYAK
jgi:hypothetical protein